MGPCVWASEPECARRPVIDLLIDVLSGDPKEPETVTIRAPLCDTHVERMLRIDSARPLFWSVSGWELIA